ncbi:hypothetical protein FOZ62_032008 [Perkinsus olseni]|uniref:Uncharacterized protein n=1 Tax=Perkinsus olseni TaxID=32597 RepID=A0A7J6TA80_PEROL|nr:hypothetical protein FOZ62_032008 [Perkinsus olseni]
MALREGDARHSVVMLRQLYEGSIQYIKRHPATPVEALATHHRNIALGFLQQFSTFGVEVCGCRAPSNRAHMRRAVWWECREAAASGMPLWQAAD